MYGTSVEQARADLGELSLASLGAIEKKDGSYRVLHDGSHGLAVNTKIRVQDQIHNPSAGDLRRATQALPSAFFVLSGDVARAHRLVKVSQCDWKYQCCRTGAKGDNLVWVNCVGTFGIASAAYHSCRLMAGVGRSSHILSLPTLQVLCSRVPKGKYMAKECDVQGTSQKNIISLLGPSSRLGN